jgi:hypothetical protein
VDPQQVNNNNNTIYKAPFPKVTKHSENDRKKQKRNANKNQEENHD